MNMKYIIIFFILAFAGCNEKSKFPEQSESIPCYHIRVVCYGIFFAIEITNDNWKTKDHIMEAFDISSQGYEGLCHQPFLDSKENCVILARSLLTWDSCVRYNKKVEEEYQGLIAYRKAHPFCTGPINVY